MTTDPNSNFRSSPLRKSRTVVFFMGLIVGVFLTLFIPYLWQLRVDLLQKACASNMKHTLLALHSYHEQYSSFPPAYTIDAEGKKLQSWRVLILPYLGEEELYRQIHLDEPWDSDHNKQFQVQMPEIFCCFADRSKRKRGETSYVWITGQGFISDGTSCTKISDIIDGTSSTLMLAETLDPILWMSPEDHSFEQYWSDTMYTSPSLSKEISSNHLVANVGFVDGGVYGWRDHGLFFLKSVLTIAGGETLVCP